VPKRNCTSRAEWRLQTGKPAAALSPHYRLDCDYGTAVIECWEKGGNEPIYVCESHAKKLGNSREHNPEARIITATSEPANNSVKREEKPRTEEAAGVKPIISAPPELKRSPAEPKASRALSAAPGRSAVRDLTLGNSAKAMVDEAIWNLASGDYEAYRTALRQGKSAGEAAQAAGGQLAVIHQKIGEYTVKLEAALSESRATISLGETVDKPLEAAMLEIIGNGTQNESEKDNAIQQLGAIQEWVKRGLQGEITPLQANQIVMAIGERLNWGGSAEVSEELKAVYRALFSSLKSKIRSAVPEGQNLQERLTNLCAAKSDLERELLGTKELAQVTR
jgi:hypothetical protein